MHKVVCVGIAILQILMVSQLSQKRIIHSLSLGALSILLTGFLVFLHLSPVVFPASLLFFDCCLCVH